MSGNKSSGRVPGPSPVILTDHGDSFLWGIAVRAILRKNTCRDAETRSRKQRAARPAASRIHRAHGRHCAFEPTSGPAVGLPAVVRSVGGKPLSLMGISLLTRYKLRVYGEGDHARRHRRQHWPDYVVSTVARPGPAFHRRGTDPAPPTDRTAPHPSHHRPTRHHPGTESSPRRKRHLDQ